MVLQYFCYSLQELPHLLSSMAPLFNLRGCTYKVQKSKEAAARVVVWRMGVVRSYTMEASYCGANLGKYKVGWEGREREEGRGVYRSKGERLGNVPACW